MYVRVYLLHRSLYGSAYDTTSRVHRHPPVSAKRYLGEFNVCMCVCLCVCGCVFVSVGDMWMCAPVPAVLGHFGVQHDDRVPREENRMGMVVRCTM